MSMTPQEAYNAIRRAGYRDGVVIKQRDEFEPDRSVASSATIITTDRIFEGVDIADVCTKVISQFLREWDYADEEGRLQRDRVEHAYRLVVNSYHHAPRP